MPGHPLPEYALLELIDVFEAEPKPKLDVEARVAEWKALADFWVRGRGHHRMRTNHPQYMGEYSQDHRKSTVLISGDNRAENGLLRQRNPPVYLGAIVLCQGADKASIRLAIVEAVTDATGLGSDRITVLKMK